jgi:hypothetical protein
MVSRSNSLSCYFSMLTIEHNLILKLPGWIRCSEEKMIECQISCYRKSRSSSDVNIMTNFFSFLLISKNTDGAGRIRTSDLQRPRLASCQARQRPRLAGCLDAIRIICLLIHSVDNLQFFGFFELEKPVRILLLPLVQPLQLVCELTLDA